MGTNHKSGNVDDGLEGTKTKAEPPRKPKSRQKGMQIMENYIYIENDNRRLHKNLRKLKYK